MTTTNDPDTASTHVSIDPAILYVGTPIALITTLSPDSTVNIGPMSSAWALGRTVVLGWESTSQTLANLEREGECVINYPHADRWQQVEAIATLFTRETGAIRGRPAPAGRLTTRIEWWQSPTRRSSGSRRCCSPETFVRGTGCRRRRS